jgi:plasmid stability protein
MVKINKIYREAKMKLFIRNFPDDLHKTLKVKAAQEGKTLYQLIIELLRKSTGQEGEKK